MTERDLTDPEGVEALAEEHDGSADAPYTPTTTGLWHRETAATLRALSARVAELEAHDPSLMRTDALVAGTRSDRYPNTQQIVDAVLADARGAYGHQNLDDVTMLALMVSNLRHHTMERNEALSLNGRQAQMIARLAAAERRAEEAEARLDSDRLCDALSEALDEQAHLTSQGGALDMHRLARAVRAKLMGDGDDQG